MAIHCTQSTQHGLRDRPVNHADPFDKPPGEATFQQELCLLGILGGRGAEITPDNGAPINIANLIEASAKLGIIG